MNLKLLKERKMIPCWVLHRNHGQHSW
jgi:hypothetical protein